MKVKVLVCCLILLLIGAVAYKITAPLTLNTENVKESVTQPTPSVDKKDIITYEPPRHSNMVDMPSGGKTRHPISGMFFVEGGKVIDPPANHGDYPYGLKVYSDNTLTAYPPIQFVRIYYFKTKEERSAFRPELHER